MRDPKKSSRSELPVSRRTLLRGAAGGAAAAALPPALVAGPKGARAKASSSAKDFSVTSGDAYDGGPVSHDITVSVKAYSALYFVVNKRQTTNFDNTEWDPNITYSD